MPLYTVKMTVSAKAREWVFGRVKHLNTLSYPRPPDVVLAINLAAEGSVVMLPGDGNTEMQEAELLALREVGLTVEAVACKVCGAPATQTVINISNDLEQGVCDEHGDAL